jgi:hypothetical protein
MEMEMSSERKMSKDVLKLIREDQKKRKDLLKSMPEGKDKEIIKEMENVMQSNEKEFY